MCIVNRSMLNIHGENVKSVASHTLLQPIQFKMDVSISLSPDVTSVPLTQIDANLGIVKVSCTGVWGWSHRGTCIQCVSFIVNNLLYLLYKNYCALLSNKKELIVPTNEIPQVCFLCSVDTWLSDPYVSTYTVNFIEIIAQLGCFSDKYMISVVCCVAQDAPGTQFSCIRSSLSPYSNEMTFMVELSARYGSSCTKFEQSCCSHS